MSDLIDRQAAIDALNEYFVRIGKLKRSGLNEGEKAIRLDTVGVIKSLSPAQPEPFGTINHAGLEHPLSDREIIPRLRQIQEQVGGSYAIDRAIELLTAQPEPCEDAVSRKTVIDMMDEWKEACADSGHKETASDIMLIRKDFIELPPVTPKQPDCAKCKSELANKIRGQQDNPGMLTENDKGRNWGLEWAAQIVEGKRR